MLPVIGDEIYVPLRQTVEYGYEDSVTIGYDNGVITLSSEYFPGFGTLALTVDSGTAYADGQAVNIAPVVKIDNVTYVSASTFEDIFGWTFEYASYDMLEYDYYYEFFTEKYYD